MSEWLKHVKKTMAENAGKPLKEVLKIAKSTYKKGSEVVKTVAKKTKKAVGMKGGKKRVARKSRKTARKSRKSRRK